MFENFLNSKFTKTQISMARNNYREYLKGDIVKAKKYFYVVRPVLACRWILDHGTNPPMLFTELMEAELPPDLRPDMERLLELKKNAHEVKMIPRIDSINRYLDESIEEIQSRIVQLPEDPCHNWEELNMLFLSQLT